MWKRLVFAALLGFVAFVATPFAERPQPSIDLIRVRLVLRTTAASCSLAVETGSVASADAPRATSLSLRVTNDANTWQVSGNTAGETADIQLQAVIAAASARRPLNWRVRQTLPGHTTLEVYNLNNENAPSLVDRFEIDAAESAVSSPADKMREGGPLDPGRISTRLVLAHYYPWYDPSTWNGPTLLDQPATPYSSDDPAAVARQMKQVKSAGIDGVIVSYQGREVGGGWNERRLRLVFQQAEQVGVKVSALIETIVANAQHTQDPVPTDPVIVESWVRQVLDVAGNSPALLRQDGRPVLFFYSANRLKPAQWADIRTRLHASGVDPLFVAENTQSPLLEAFDGEFDYASNRFSPSDFLTFDRRQGLRVQTHHLLGAGHGSRRIWAATVSPGYNDVRLAADGRTTRVTERQGGAYYESQWHAALASGADWVLITSWNEWFENTAIEPAVSFGDEYLRRTRFWTYLFHTAQ